MRWLRRRGRILSAWLFALVLVCVAFAAKSAFAADSASDPNAGLPKLTPDNLDRATPQKSALGFFGAAKSGKYTRAAYYLDLRGIPTADQADKGPVLAEELFYVLTHEKLDASKLPDTPDGTSPTSPTPVTQFTAASLYIGEEPVPMSMVRITFDDGVARWLVSRTTVAMIPELDAAYGPKGWRTKLPTWLTAPMFLGNELWQWLGILVFAVLSYVFGRIASHFVVYVGLKLAAHSDAFSTNDRLIIALRRPLRTVIAATMFRGAIATLDLTNRTDAACTHVAYTTLVIALAWLVLRVLGVTATWMQERASTGDGDTVGRTRAIRTQLTLIRRLAGVAVTLIATAVIALQFEFVRNVGVSLLASAGIVSVVIGFAAQKSLAGVIAGIQLFIAHPVRIGDTVEIEGENGTMEELNLTYAVVKLWDERRMVVPIAKLLDTSFKNLSLAPHNLLGTVELVVDSATPVEAVRARLVELCTEGATNGTGRPARCRSSTRRRRG